MLQGTTTLLMEAGPYPLMLHDWSSLVDNLTAVQARLLAHDYSANLSGSVVPPAFLRKRVPTALVRELCDKARHGCAGAGCATKQLTREGLPACH